MNDGDAVPDAGRGTLERARACAYLSSVVRASEGVETARAPGALEALEMMAERAGLDALAKLASERGRGGWTSTDRAPGDASKLLPEVSMKDFEGYLSAMRERYAGFVEDRERSARSAEAGSSGWSPAGTAGSERGVESVPALFFDEIFELYQPETFSRACVGLDEVNIRNLARAAMETQEDFIAHLDAVEEHLIREIGEKSDEFFTALSDLHHLHEAMAGTQRQVASMRKSVRDIREQLVKPGQLMLSLRDKRDNLETLTETFTKVAALQQMRTDMDVFVESSDYSGALQLAEDIKKALAEDEVLAKLTCFGTLPEHVEYTRNKVREVMISDFVEGASLPKDARTLVSARTLDRLSEVAKTCGMEPPQSNSKLTQQTIDEEINSLEKMIPPFISLLYSGSSFVCEALQIWLTAIVEDVRLVERVAIHIMLSTITQVRRQITPSTDDTVFDSVHATVIRSLPAEVFAELLLGLKDIFNSYFERAKEVRAMVRAVITSDEESLAALRGIGEGLISAARDAAVNIDHASSQSALAIANEALSKVIDIAQGRFAKLLGVRAPMNVASSSREFMAITEATNAFLELAETVGKHRCLSLRTTLVNQGKSFVREQHSLSASKLISLLECETWARAKLPVHLQALVDALMEGAMTFPDVKSEDIGDVSSIVVGGELFHPVNSAVLLLQILVDYVRMARQNPSLSTEMTHRTIDLIKQYNAGVCQLILGAGAMQVSKLKSITAKHLCLAQQSVSLFASLLPTLQEAMCALIEGPKHVLLRQEFERMLRDLKLHKSEIHDKLVSIMRDRVEFHLYRLASIVESLRDEGNVKQVDGASDFAISLTKEMGTLRRVICELLSEDDRRDVLGRVRAEAVASIVSRVQSLESGDNLRIIAQLSVDLDVCADSMKEMPVSGADASEDALASLASAFRLKVPPPVVNEPADDVSAREKEQVGQNKAADDKPSTD